MNQSGTPSPSTDISIIVFHNCEEKGHITCIFLSPRTTNINQISRCLSSNLVSTSSQSTVNWLTDNGTMHHLIFDLDNLVVHSKYHGPKEITLGNGFKLLISYIGERSLSIFDKSYVLDNLLYAPAATKFIIY